MKAPRKFALCSFAKRFRPASAGEEILSAGKAVSAMLHAAVSPSKHRNADLSACLADLDTCWAEIRNSKVRCKT